MLWAGWSQRSICSQAPQVQVAGELQRCTCAPSLVSLHSSHLSVGLPGQTHTPHQYVSSGHDYCLALPSLALHWQCKQWLTTGCRIQCSRRKPSGSVQASIRWLHRASLALMGHCRELACADSMEKMLCLHAGHFLDNCLQSNDEMLGWGIKSAAMVITRLRVC